MQSFFGHEQVLQLDDISIVDATKFHMMLFSAQGKSDEAEQMLGLVLAWCDQRLMSYQISIADTT